MAGSITSTFEVEDVIKSGKAYQKMCEWIEAQGGNLEKLRSDNEPKFILECRSDRDAYVKTLDALQVGTVIHELAYKPTNDGAYQIDNSAGVILKAKIGDAVKPGDVLFSIQGSNQAELELAKDKLLEAYKFSDAKVRKPNLVLRKIV